MWWDVELGDIDLRRTPGWLKFQLIGFVICVVLTFTAGYAGIILWAVILFIGCIQLVTWLLRTLVIPGIRAVGEGGRNTVADVAETGAELYSVTVLPIARFVTFCIQLPGTLKAWREGKASFQWKRASSQGSSSDSSSRGQRQRTQSQQQGQNSHQYRDDEDDEEDTYNWRKGQRQQHGGSQTQQEAPKTRSCYEILGVSPNTDLETARKAYLEKMKKCHPDVVSGLDPRFRPAAEQMAKELNEAWTLFQLMKKHMG